MTRQGHAIAGRGSGGWTPGRHSLELTGKELRA